MAIHVFAFLGGLAMLLYGMQLMSRGLQQAAGERLQKILEMLTGRIVLGVALGAVVTAVLQSSAATTVMTVGLVDAGLLTLKQAFGIIMGANVGTTITAQLIAFKLSDYVPLVFAIGFVLQILGRRQTIKYMGQVLIGFGLLMMGIGMMSNAVLPLRQNASFVAFVGTFARNPLLGVGVGIIMTICIQSSAATIGILMAMASQGIITLDGAVPVLFGDNIGTCLTSVLASLRSQISAKRVAASHIGFNLIGSLIFLCILPYFIDFVLAISPGGDIARQIANAHTSFNLINTLLFLPFAGPYTELLKRLLPGKEEIISSKPEFLNDEMLGTPAIAMSLATKEIDRMGSLAVKNITLATEAVNDHSEEKIDYILEHEVVIDSLEKDIIKYLTRMAENDLSLDISSQHTRLIHACTDIERIGDHAETLAKRVRKMEEEPVNFSPEAEEELRQLGELIVAASSKAITALATNDQALAAEAITTSRQAKALQKEIRKNHVTRLNTGTCSPMAGFVLMEFLINMKRVSDHAKNIGQLVLGQF